MLRRVKQPNEGTFLNTKACYLLIWANKQLGNVMSKDVIKYICKKYLVCVCYAEHCFHAKFGKRIWDSERWSTFLSVLSTRVNELSFKERSDADEFVFALSCSLILVNYPVRIVWFEQKEPFGRIDDITREMELDIRDGRYQAIEQKSMSVSVGKAKVPYVFYARKTGSKPLLRWQSIKNYQDRLHSREEYVIFYGCEQFSKKYLRVMQSNPGHGILFVSIK